MDHLLSQPVGTLMRPSARIEAEDSIRLASERMRDNGVSELPVVQGGRLIGLVTERSLADALADARDLDEAGTVIMTDAATVYAYQSGAEALRRMHEADRGVLMVVDESGQLMGLLRASDLMGLRSHPPRPPMVGGMATPFGVYLTTGSIRAGAGGWALVATGALLLGLYLGGTLISWYAGLAMERAGAPERLAQAVIDYLPLVLFLLGMRALPLAGIHAAEHMVVHAIERGEELRPSIIRRMPRVHPRCGTNVAAGATLFLGIFGTHWIPDESLRLMVALLATMFLWRPLGSALQFWVTTRRPNERQIAMGLRAGQELLQRYATARNLSANPLVRLYNMGIFHVMAGSSIAFGVVYGINQLFRLDLPL